MIKNSMTGGNIKNSMKEEEPKNGKIKNSMSEEEPKGGNIKNSMKEEEPKGGNIKNSMKEETTKKAPRKKNKNPILELPDDLQIIINEYAQDKTQYKIFNDSYDMYYKLYKNLKNTFNFNDNIKIYNEIEEEGNKNFIVIVNNKLNYYVDLKTDEETETEKDEYLKENIIYIYNDVSFYDRVLKDQFYIKNDYRKGIKKNIIKKIKKAIEEENNIYIYNLLDLETFYNNYFRFNNICDFLNLYDYIENIKIIENGEREGTRRRTTYNILIREN